MRPTHLIVLALGGLAACAMSPRQQCEATHRNDLATVRAEIRETELLLRRGFRLVPAESDFGLHYCESPGLMVTPCFGKTDEPMFDKRPINRRAEAAKLDALRAERKRLEVGLAQCAVQYPE